MFPISKFLRFTRQPVLNRSRCFCDGKSNSTSNKLQTVADTQDTSVLKKYDPNAVTKESMRWRTPWHQKEGEYYSMLRAFYSDKPKTHILKRLQTPIDLSPGAIKRWFDRTKKEIDVSFQAYLPQRNQALGDELAAAHFVVSRGGAVKFHNEDVWIKADKNDDYDLPKFYQDDKVLQAIDCYGMTLYYEGLVNLADLENVEWLSLNSCENMDDWCLDKICNIFSHSLIYLDLRDCSNITYRGLSAILKLQNLKILYLDDFLRTTSYEYTCLLLEELMPNLEIKSDTVTFEIK